MAAIVGRCLVSALHGRLRILGCQMGRSDLGGDAVHGIVVQPTEPATQAGRWVALSRSVT